MSRAHNRNAAGLAITTLLALVATASPLRALTTERCISTDNHVYVIITTGSGNIGTMVTSVAMSANSSCSLSEIGPVGSVLTAYAAGPGVLLSNRMRTQVISGLPSNTISCATNFDPHAGGGEGALILPGAVGVVSADPSTSTEPLLPVTIGDANYATDPSAVPPGADIAAARTITAFGNPVTCAGNAMSFPIGGGGTTLSDPNTGEVGNQSVTLDDTSGTRVGNPTSQPSRPDGFLLQGNCSNPATCQTIVFTATCGATLGLGVAAAGFTVDGSFMQTATEGAQMGMVCNTLTPTPSSSPTPTPTANPTESSTPSTPSPTPTSTPLCPEIPRTGCRTAGRSTLLVRTDDNSARNRLIWRWTRGATTTQDDFGNPIAQTRYALCVYDSNGRRAALEVPPAGTCGAHDCWRLIPRRGYRYVDRSGGNEGTTRIVLRGHDLDKAKIVFKSQGQNMPDPMLPYNPPVLVQLVNDETDVCWEAGYVLSDFLQNGNTRFKAKQRD